jgi:SAM-dependent methyltransferase
MSGHTHPHGEPSDANDWDERYGDEQMWSGHPNEQLVVELSDLDPGTALDVGCGEGADAIWLAGDGWRVTGIDVSATALGRAARASEMAGAAVEWRAVDIEDIDDATYDLVISFYPAILRGDGDVIDTLLGTVAPGGTLLVVHHAFVDVERALEHGFDPDDYVRHYDLVDALTGRGGWVIEVAEARSRTAPEGPGAHHHVDHVLRARRV